MREFLVSFMANYASEIVFVHVLGAIIWVGGMIVVKLAVRPSILNISDDKIRVARVLEIMDKMFIIAIVWSIMIVLTAVVFIVGLDLKHAGSMYKLVLIKESVWMVMFFVLVYITILRKQAQRLFVSGDIESSKNKINIIENMIFINIILGITSLYLGISLRGY
jgi:uncharacterized membrane protein